MKYLSQIVVTDQRWRFRIVHYAAPSAMDKSDFVIPRCVTGIRVRFSFTVFSEKCVKLRVHIAIPCENLVYILESFNWIL